MVLNLRGMGQQMESFLEGANGGMYKEKVKRKSFGLMKHMNIGRKATHHGAEISLRSADLTVSQTL